MPPLHLSPLSHAEGVDVLLEGALGREAQPPDGLFLESLLVSEPRMDIAQLSLGGIGQDERSILAELAERATPPVITFTDGPVELWGVQDAEIQNSTKHLDSYLEALRRLDQQAAFLEYLADDGIVFRPGPVPGKEWIAAHEPASGRLEWVPVAAAVDCSATLAVSTGRWRYSNPAGGEPVAGCSGLEGPSGDGRYAQDADRADGERQRDDAGQDPAGGPAELVQESGHLSDLPAR